MQFEPTLEKSIFQKFKNGFRYFGKTIEKLVNSVLLLAVYLIGIGLTSVLAKIVGKRFLDTKISSDRKSYWIPTEKKEKNMESLLHQF